MPHILTEPCLNVLQEMFCTLYDSFGAGLAAPQVGIRWQLAVIDTVYGAPATGGDRSSEERRRLILINPVVLPDQEASQSGNVLETRASATENCLSLPGYTGDVLRPKRIRVRNGKLDGSVEEFSVSGFLARVILHEMDHLNGILFSDRLTNAQDLNFSGESRYAPRSAAALREAGISSP